MILRRTARFAFCVNECSVDANAYMNHGCCRQKERKDRGAEGSERLKVRKDREIAKSGKDREIAKAGKEKKVRKDSREDSYEGGNSK